MIVTVGGMYRSGSTFSFNIVREILCDLGSVVTVSDNILANALSASEDSEHLIIKSHAPDELITSLINKRAILCICTYRKPEDSIASYVRVFGGTLESATSMVESWLEWHSKTHDRVLNIPYEQIENDPLGTIYQIQRYLTGAKDTAQAVILKEKYQKETLKDQLDLLQKSDSTTDLGFTYYDNETYFHRKHISSIKSTTALEEFSQSQISKIRNRLSRFIDIEGNYFGQGKRIKNVFTNSRLIITLLVFYEKFR
ncbi:MAG: sulfotransferase [Methylococcaceae bacterium]|nr:sulfotransferase [Methylococcaceae bacterium]